MFIEKPIATDSPGVRSFLESVEKAKSKNLSLVSGLCWRYHQPRRETMDRVKDGQIGSIVAVETTYDSGGVWEPRVTRDQVGSDMEYEMRNWYYYTWLCGDHIVEQAVHGLDTMGWALGDAPPIQCWGSGGRQARTDPKYGDIYDHFSIVYEYPNNVRGYHNCRHWRDTAQRLKDYVLGSTGYCDVFGSKITGAKPCAIAGRRPTCIKPSTTNSSPRSERASRSTTANTPRSTLLAIMGRMAAYTGEVITWEAALNSKESLGPKTYVWGELPKREVPKPGVTKFA